MDNAGTKELFLKSSARKIARALAYESGLGAAATRKLEVKVERGVSRVMVTVAHNAKDCSNNPVACLESLSISATGRLQSSRNMADIDQLNTHLIRVWEHSMQQTLGSVWRRWITWNIQFHRSHGPLTSATTTAATSMFQLPLPNLTQRSCFPGNISPASAVVFRIRELCDLISNQIALQSSPQLHLKSAALVCPTMCSSAQTHVFRDIIIDPSQFPSSPFKTAVSSIRHSHSFTSPPAIQSLNLTGVDPNSDLSDVSLVPETGVRRHWRLRSSVAASVFSTVEPNPTALLGSFALKVTLPEFPALTCLEINEASYRVIFTLSPDNCLERLVLHSDIYSFASGEGSDSFSGIRRLRRQLTALRQVEVQITDGPDFAVETVELVFPQYEARGLLAVTDKCRPWTVYFQSWKEFSPSLPGVPRPSSIFSNYNVDNLESIGKLTSGVVFTFNWRAPPGLDFSGGDF
ncbi:hypothetical protein DFH09DRAFT_1276701 [Mycena vulgaris]|nr:hypothetical protein DFH09DRAFT_1276701 [Mycena vulgaris]